MRPDKQMMGLMALVAELKRRRIFNSLLITNSGVQIGYWDQRECRPVITDEFGARMYLKSLAESEKRALESEAWRYLKYSMRGGKGFGFEERRNP